MPESIGSLELPQDHRPLADLVFESLRDAIIDGRLKGDQWLRQEVLAQELGVSHMPVREALKRLVAEGLAEQIPYRGVKVIKFSPEDYVDICIGRLALESLAVRYATSLIADEGVERLKDSLREMERCTSREQMARRRHLNAQFHLSLCRASAHKFLVRMVETLWNWFPNVLLYEGAFRKNRKSEDLIPWMEQEMREHWAILKAVERQDAQQAEEQVRRHIRNLAPELIETLDVPQELGDLLTAFWP